VEDPLRSLPLGSLDLLLGVRGDGGADGQLVGEHLEAVDSSGELELSGSAVGVDEAPAPPGDGGTITAVQTLSGLLSDRVVGALKGHVVGGSEGSVEALGHDGDHFEAGVVAVDLEALRGGERH